MKKVLIITYYWPPVGGSGVQRWAKFAKYLPEMGWKPIIYTPENPEMTSIDKQLAEELPKEIEVIKTKITEPYNIYRRLFGTQSSTDLKVLTSKDKKPSWKNKLSLFIRSNFFIPDPRVWWVNKSVKFLKKYLEENHVDAIITTGPPQSMHLIGLKLSKTTCYPWFADFRDPWTKMYWYKKMPLCNFAKKKNNALEKEILDNATGIIAVNPFVQKDFQAMTKTPVHLITNGYDEEDFNQIVEPDGNFNIVHTGLFPMDGNPEILWEILKQKCLNEPEFKKRMRIRLVGKTDSNIIASIKNAGLEQNTIDLGYKEHRFAVREQIAASLLLLPLRNDPDNIAVLPGKVFEYLASKRPILGIGQENGVMASVIHNAGAGNVCDWNNADGIKKMIDTVWKEYLLNIDNTINADIEQYTRKNLTKKLIEILENE